MKTIVWEIVEQVLSFAVKSSLDCSAFFFIEKNEIRRLINAVFLELMSHQCLHFLRLSMAQGSITKNLVLVV